MPRLQKTISREITFEGKGLHTGRDVVMRLKPAPRDTGLVFYRSDKGVFINATLRAVSDTAFATTLGYNGTSVKTVEHILAAASGMGIDNLLIDVNGPEVPILDGSSARFAQSIVEAGTARQSSNRSYLRVVKPVLFREGNTHIAAIPYDGRLITYQIYFDHPMLGLQKMSLELTDDNFIREIAPARTFGFLRDVETLRSRGLARGGSPENAVIITENGILNASGLRFKDEFIRHKILDFIGDLALGGLPIHGHFVVNRSGHTTNTRFLKKFLSSPDCWRIVTGAGLPAKAIA